MAEQPDLERRNEGRGPEKSVYRVSAFIHKRASDRAYPFVKITVIREPMTAERIGTVKVSSQ